MANVIQWQGVSYNNKPYPGWAEFLGWLMALSSMVLIPAFAIYQLWKTPGTLKEVRILFLNSHVVVRLSYQTWCRLTFVILRSPPLAIYVLGGGTFTGRWGREILLVTKCLEIWTNFNKVCQSLIKNRAFRYRRPSWFQMSRV